MNVFVKAANISAYIFLMAMVVFPLSTQGEPISAKTYPNYPQTTLSNGLIGVSIYLPDAEKGYYRGTRFDWSGVISRVQYAGHTFYGEWKERHDPTHHDDIVGPVEEFSMEDPLGYEDAGPGDPFVKIGVGALIRPNNSEYRFHEKYKIQKAGTWEIKQEKDWIEFYQEFEGPDEWAYHYTKRIELLESQPAFVIKHTLKNIGFKTIDTTHYNHNFTIIDDEPIGLGYEISFPFALDVEGEFNNCVEIEDKQIQFTKANEPGHVMLFLQNDFSSAEENQITITNKDARAGIHINGDQTPFKINVWSQRWTVSPEPFIKIQVERGETMQWEYKYRFVVETSVK